MPLRLGQPVGRAVRAEQTGLAPRPGVSLYRWRRRAGANSGQPTGSLGHVTEN